MADYPPEYLQKAIRYFKKAVDKGSIKAANELVRIYYYEKQDPKSAAKYILFSAINGDATALQLFGQILTFGELGEVDFENAFCFYDEAARRGNESAMCNIAICYLNGYGTNVNYSEAQKYLNRAKQSSNPEVRKYAQSLISKYKDELSKL